MNLTNELKTENRKGTMKKYFNNQPNISHKKTHTAYIQQEIHKAQASVTASETILSPPSILPTSQQQTDRQAYH